MKKLSAFSLLAALALFSFMPAEVLQIGASMPKGNIKMKDISGKEVSIKDAEGKNGVLVMFSCNTCPYVIKNQERTNEIMSYALKNNVGVIILNSNEAYRDKDDSFNEMQAYAKAQGYKWYYTVDTNHEIADAFGATRTPELFLFDKSEKLVYHGAIDDSPADAAAVKRHHAKVAIDELVSGKDISVKTSKSIGCTIKRKS
ncbi:MAG: thioredoxin family protein [Chitinophagaceae bacterium]|nr:thioredoxin family protein [Chitinophagaceae bacterium]MCU0404932.1 thioredoxin family protein [Chitinophagaceae bacterium]